MRWLEAKCMLYAQTMVWHQKYHSGKFVNAQNELYKKGWVQIMQPGWK